MLGRVSSAVAFLMLAQTAPELPRATVSAQTFAGTWVGTQSWAIDNPPPGTRPDQPVELTLAVLNGRIVGTLVPFMGGQDGATIVDAQIVGDELRASAVVGRGRVPTGEAAAPAGRGRRGGGPVGFKDGTKIQFVFRNDGLALTGTADVTLNDVKWMKFKYDLSRKRSRY